MASQNQDTTVRFVVYDIATKRPVSQGLCLRRDFPLVVQNLPHGQGGDRAKIMNSNDVLDLTPYDVLLDPNEPEIVGELAWQASGAAMMGKTVDDAITDIDDLDTET
jgi:hypothetical protein